jgi:hypothetical protein
MALLPTSQPALCLCKIDPKFHIPSQFFHR